MAVTKGLIVYSPATLAPRRVVIPDDDAQLHQLERWTTPGEAAIAVPLGELALHDVDASLASALGVAREDIGHPRAAVVDQFGEVAHVVMAEPGLDAPHDPRHTLILHPVADIGWEVHPDTGELHNPAKAE